MLAQQDLIKAPFKTDLVCPRKLKHANGNILVSVSGGADSDIVIDLIQRHKDDANVTYVWFDTGLEYEATKKHLVFLQEKYGIVIETEKAVVPIPKSCKEKGVPFLSKEVSDMISRLQKHGFKWEDKSFEELYEEYPKCKSALRWWCNKRNGDKGISNISYLKDFIIQNPPDFKISSYCCTGAKKRPANNAKKRFKAVLNITGERKAEGGLRAFLYKSCFTEETDDHIASYRPIFFFTDQDKKEYKAEHCIKHSDCYEVWGMKRTGCAGCPFGSRFEDELELIKKYEPKLYDAANFIFGKSYDYTRQYRNFKEKKKLKN